MSDWEEETPTSVTIFDNLRQEFENTFRHLSFTRSYLKKTHIDNHITNTILSHYLARLAEASNEDNKTDNVSHSDAALKSFKNTSHPKLLTEHSEEAIGFPNQAESNFDLNGQNENFKAFNQEGDNGFEILPNREELEVTFNGDDQNPSSSSSENDFQLQVNLLNAGVRSVTLDHNAELDGQDQENLTEAKKDEEEPICCAYIEEEDFILKTALGFVLQAKSDQDCAVQLSKLGFNGQAAFFLQQSAEKNLKAILINLYGSYDCDWKTNHNLGILSGLVRKHLNPQSFGLYNASKALDEIGTGYLNPSLLCIRARYPQPDALKIVDINTFPSFAFKEEDIKKGMDLLEEIVQFTQNYFDVQMGPSVKYVFDDIAKTLQI
jgi:HEPN domain-containing protein